MKKVLVLMCAMTLVCVVTGLARADTILLANLTNSQEIPPAYPTLSSGDPRLASFGNASFLLNDAMTSMTFSATIFNIDFTGTQTSDPYDNLWAAHIHAGPTVTPSTNGPVVWGFFGTPLNDNNPNDVVVTPFAIGVGGTISGKWDMEEGNGTTLTDQLSNILSGHAYINFHTVQFPGGEVRGTLEMVPDPGSSLLLLGMGFAGLRAARKRWQ